MKNPLFELSELLVENYKESKAKNEKWLAENEDLKGSYAYESVLLGNAFLDVGIAFWSSFLTA